MHGMHLKRASSSTKSLLAKIELIKWEWIEMEKPYFEALADSMQQRMRQVIKVKENITKY